MQYKKMLLVAVLSVASSTAMAGAFDGPFVQAAVGFANAQTEVNAPAWFTSKPSDNNFIGQISGGYSRSFGQFNLGGSVFYILGDQKAGAMGYNSPGIGTIEFKGKNTWGLSIEPGYMFYESALVYAKIGYVDSKVNGSDNWTSGGLAHSSAFDESVHGYSYGAGVKVRFSPNLYGIAEIQQINYRSKTWTYSNGYQVAVKPNALTGVIGIGYKF